jgi:hypothetical protein
MILKETFKSYILPWVEIQHLITSFDNIYKQDKIWNMRNYFKYFF